MHLVRQSLPPRHQRAAYTARPDTRQHEEPTFSNNPVLIGQVTTDPLGLLDQGLKHALHMLLPHGGHPQAHPNGKLAVDNGARQVEAAAGIHSLVHLLRARIHLVLVLPGDAQRDQAEPRSCKDGKQVPPAAQPLLELLAHGHAVANVRLQAAYAVAAQDEPQLERAEAPAEWDLPVSVVGDELVVRELVAQVRRLDAQRGDEVGAGAHKRRAAVKRGEHPLVRVEVERVEVHERRGDVLVLREEERRAGVGGVDVDEQLRLAGGDAALEDARDAGKVVDGADVGGAHGGGEVEGLQALGGELVERLGQGLALHGQPVLLVDGDGGEAHAEHLGGLLGARVRAGAAQGDELAPQAPYLLLLVFAVGEVCRLGGNVLVSRANHDGEDGLAGRAMQDAAAVGAPAGCVALREAEGLGDPVEHNGLELRDGRAADPVEVGAAEGVGVHLGNGGRVAARAGEEGHEAGTGPVRDARHDLVLDIGADGVERLRV